MQVEQLESRCTPSTLPVGGVPIGPPPGQDIVPVFVTGAVKLTASADKAAVAAGETFHVTINTTDLAGGQAPTGSGEGFQLAYGSRALTLVEIDHVYGPGLVAVQEGGLVDGEPTAGVVTAAWVEPYSVNWVPPGPGVPLVTLTFVANPGFGGAALSFQNVFVQAGDALVVSPPVIVMAL